VPKKKYRVALVGGAGTWGRRYLHAYAQHPDCEIVALVDRAADRRHTFAAHYGIATHYDTLDQLLDRDVPDVVSAVVPVDANPAAVIACAEAGVRVVSCEKPIAAQLSQADDMVRICRQRGTVFSCGSIYSGIPHLSEIIDWIRQGHLGQLTVAAIPSGLPKEVAGGACVQLSLLRLLSNLEVEWVEGWTLPPTPEWTWPSDVPEDEIDCPAYGRLGLANGTVCEIPAPGNSNCLLALTGAKGQFWLSHARPVFVLGTGAASSPVFPDFLNTAADDDAFTLRITRLLRSCDSGRDELDSGQNYHQALEIAIALKLSDRNRHQRITLPLPDRSLRIAPHPYRLHGGDVAGWESIGYKGPPTIE
jgi:hypothetical protein